MGYSLGQLGSALTAMFPSKSCALQPAHWWNRVSNKRPWHCASTAQQELKQPYVINTGLVTNPKHNTSWATMKKCNPNLTVKPSIEAHYSSSEEGWFFVLFLFFGENFKHYDFLFLGWSHSQDAFLFFHPSFPLNKYMNISEVLLMIFSNFKEVKEPGI